MSRKITLLLTTLMLTAIFMNNGISHASISVFGANSAITIETSNVRIAIDLAHDPETAGEDIDNLKTIVSSNYAELIELTDSYTSTDLQVGSIYVDVLIIMAPRVNYTEDEIEAINNMIIAGKSLLIAGTYNENTSSVLNFLCEELNLGISFTKEQAPNPDQLGVNKPDIKLTNFNTPRIPAVEDVVQVMFYNGIEIEMNQTAIDPPEDNALLKDLYSIIDNPNTPNDPKSLIYGMEFKSTITEHTFASRFLFTGSASMFNDSFIVPVEDPQYEHYDNTDILLGSLNWLSRITGFFTYNQFTLVNTPTRIDIAEKVGARINITNHNDENTDNVVVTISLERAGSILASSYMVLEDGYYKGNVTTSELKEGWVDVRITAQRRGYVTFESDAIPDNSLRVFINPHPADPQPANFALFVAFLGISVILVLSAIKIYPSVGKIE